MNKCIAWRSFLSVAVLLARGNAALCGDREGHIVRALRSRLFHPVCNRAEPIPAEPPSSVSPAIERFLKAKRTGPIARPEPARFPRCPRASSEGIPIARWQGPRPPLFRPPRSPGLCPHPCPQGHEIRPAAELPGEHKSPTPSVIPSEGSFPRQMPGHCPTPPPGNRSSV